MWSHWSTKWRPIDKRLVYDRLRQNRPYSFEQLDKMMNESMSDHCVGELVNDGCDISDTCWQTMTRDGLSDYQLSHQVFYLSLGRMAGCQPHLERLARATNHGSIEQMLDTFCSNMLYENLKIAANGFPSRDRDFFLENGKFTMNEIGYH